MHYKCKIIQFKLHLLLQILICIVLLSDNLNALHKIARNAVSTFHILNTISSWMTDDHQPHNFKFVDNAENDLLTHFRNLVTLS